MQEREALHLLHPPLLQPADRVRVAGRADGAGLPHGRYAGEAGAEAHCVEVG
uniref:Uncharacterized protein n=1 Tax=Zea mays TaxID=4577 RepID=C4J7S7_MAIZE|nr:unknown [Zea mays]